MKADLCNNPKRPKSSQETIKLKPGNNPKTNNKKKERLHFTH